MLYKKVKTKFVAFFLCSAIAPLMAYTIEVTDAASINKFDPQKSQWTFELWNKTKKSIFITVSYDKNNLNGIISFPLKPNKKARSNIFAEIPLYIHIWNNAQSMPFRQPDFQRRIDTRGKTAYLSYEKNVLRPQKGDGTKTQSGLFITNNVSNNDIFDIEK